MLSPEKTERITKLYRIFKNTGQDEFPFIDTNMNDGLKMYFGKPPTYLLFILTNVVSQPVYVGMNDSNT